MSQIHISPSQDRKIRELMDFLELPTHFDGIYIDTTKLYNIVSDPVKLKRLINKLKELELEVFR